MVGFDPSKEKLSKAEHGAAGAVSGAATRFLCQPLDVIKIRFQLQVEPINPKFTNSKYQGLVQATQRIIRDEGITALWKGHVPAQILSIVYGFSQFLSFEILTQQAWHTLPFLRDDSYRPFVHFICGGLAGTIATVASFPSDVVRTRLIAQGEPKVYKGLAQAVTMIYKLEGPSAFFKGLSPTILQVAPHAGAHRRFLEFFASHLARVQAENDFYVQNANGSVGYVPISSTGSLVCGSIAGICAKAFVYPFDLARKRLQIQGFQHAREGFGKPFTCNGLLQCLYVTIRDETLLGLYKGLWPSLLKAAATSALHFCIYEQTCHAIALAHR
ncbi:hypothetical protein L9F63_003365 [Diploptera punctata]|uniref:Mitochondrial thiamine pyrophosphate carrier n=1 Tax=Diploptera punctata TaxID=6984 RepID=A0AAD8E9V7_DIPPU|nr:hypothetical protein L9F63_003365 [Diploptera punctata]